jgi:hypothetical protein
MTSRITEKCTHTWCQRTLQMIMKLVVWDSGNWHIMPIIGCKLSHLSLQGMKSRFIMWHVKPKKHPQYGNTNHLPQQRNSKQCHSKEDHGNCLLGPQRCASCRISLTMVTLLLLSVNVEHFRGYGRPFTTKGMGCCANASQFCMIRLCPILLTDLWLVKALRLGSCWSCTQ